MRPLLLQGHERPLTQIKYNRDGDLLFSCSKDKTICVWYADNGERLGTGLKFFSSDKTVFQEPTTGTRVPSGPVTSTGTRRSWPLVVPISPFVCGMLRLVPRPGLLMTKTADSLPLLKVSISPTAEITSVSQPITIWCFQICKFWSVKKLAPVMAQS